MQRKRGPSELPIIRRAGIAALALLMVATVAVTAMACWPRPIPAATVAADGTSGGSAAMAPQAADTPASLPASATTAAPKPRPAPTSPELPNKFEQARFRVPAHPRPLAPVLANAPRVGSTEVADDAPSQSRRAADDGALDGTDSPAAASRGQEAAGSGRESTPASGSSMSPPE